MAKYFIGAIIVILILISGYYTWQTFGTAAPPSYSPEDTPSMNTYATSTFSITYPSTYAVDDTYAYDQFEGKPIAGLKFSVPLAMTEGTNLSSDSGVSVEWLPRAKNCTGDIYIKENVRAQSVTENGVEYSVATSSGAAAGNLYEEQVYALVGS